MITTTAKQLLALSKEERDSFLQNLKEENRVIADAVILKLKELMNYE